MNPLQQDLQMQPPFPQGFPTRRPIPSPPQLSAQPRHLLPEHRDGHLLQGEAARGCNDRHGSRFHMLQRRRFWRQSCQITQLRASAPRGARATPAGGVSARWCAGNAPPDASRF